MKITQRGLKRPDGSDHISISELSDNFKLLNKLILSTIHNNFGGYINNDDCSVTSNKIYIDSRDYKVWYIQPNSNGSLFNSADKKHLNLNCLVPKGTQISDGSGLNGGGCLSQNISFNVTKATSSSLGAIRLGRGLHKHTDGVIDAIPIVGSILFLTQEDNPNTIYPNSSWEKIETGFIKGTSSNQQNSGFIGGNNSKTLSASEMPRHRHTAHISAHNHSVNESPHTHTAYQDSHKHTQPNHHHGMQGEHNQNSPFGIYNGSYNHSGSRGGMDTDNATFKTSSNYAGSIGYAQPSISIDSSKANFNRNTSGTSLRVTLSHHGGGNSFNKIPSYYTVNIWKRIK